MSHAMQPEPVVGSANYSPTLRREIVDGSALSPPAPLVALVRRVSALSAQLCATDAWSRSDQ